MIEQKIKLYKLFWKLFEERRTPTPTYALLVHDYELITGKSPDPLMEEWDMVRDIAENY